MKIQLNAIFFLLFGLRQCVIFRNRYTDKLGKSLPCIDVNKGREGISHSNLIVTEMMVELVDIKYV